MEKKSKTLQHVMNAHEEIVLQGRRKLKISVYPLLSYKLPFMDHSLVVSWGRKESDVTERLN